MEPLPTTHQMMTWLSMCPVDDSKTLTQKTTYIIAYTLVILITIVLCFVASLAYCLKYFSIDFDGAAFGFMSAIGEFGLVYFMIVAIRMRHQISNIFADLSHIYNCRKFDPKKKSEKG